MLLLDSIPNSRVLEVDKNNDETMEDIIDEIQTKSGVKNLEFQQPKHEEEKAKENILDGGGADENSLLIIKELKNLDQNKVKKLFLKNRPNILLFKFFVKFGREVVKQKCSVLTNYLLPVFIETKNRHVSG